MCGAIGSAVVGAEIVLGQATGELVESARLGCDERSLLVEHLLDVSEPELRGGLGAGCLGAAVSGLGEQFVGPLPSLGQAAPGVLPRLVHRRVGGRSCLSHHRGCFGAGCGDDGVGFGCTVARGCGATRGHGVGQIGGFPERMRR